METLKLINGNNQEYNLPLPKLVIIGEKWNDQALNHVSENTGLTFTECMGGMEVQPRTSQQIVKLFLTYNFKTKYYNNLSTKNTLFLKGDHHVGFGVDSICFECCKENNINTSGLTPTSRLAC